jgi:hypothetical protein
MISRFFAHDFDYENLSLRISEGGVLPRRTKNPFMRKVKTKKTKKTKRKTQAPNARGIEAEADESTKVKPTPVARLEAEEHEKDLRSDSEVEVEASPQDRAEPPGQAVEQSEGVGTLEEGVTVEVSLTLLECL